MTISRLKIVDRFAPEADALRSHFDDCFADPRSTRDDRFVWDLWSVPNQYTALRTPAYLYFPQKIYDAFHQRLVWWGRRTLGCHDVSPPWLSCYVNGCEQRLHGDVPHGHWAFVYSLTPWASRTFHGGETLLLREDVLDFWRTFESNRGLEEPEIVEAIEPKFNRLTVFDPRVPHGVRRVDGSMDPREGRLVIHGWFVQPRPFIEGPLTQTQLGRGIEQISEAIAPHLEAGLSVTGLLSLELRVTPIGTVQKATVLCDTTRVPFEANDARTALIRSILKAARAIRFSKHAKPSRITLPLVFESAAAS